MDPDDRLAHFDVNVIVMVPGDKERAGPPLKSFFIILTTIKMEVSVSGGSNFKKVHKDI